MDKKNPTFIKFYLLLKEFMPILKMNNNENMLKEAILYSSGIKSSVLVVSLSEKEKLMAPINFLLELPHISRLHSKDFVYNKVIELYHSILENNSSEEELSLNSFEFLYNTQPITYTIISGIENLRVEEEKEYMLIDSVIKKIKKEDLPDSPQELPSLIGKVCIITKVIAGDSIKAKEIAEHNFVLSFNLIKLYFPTFKPFLDGCCLSGNKSFIILNSDSGKRGFQLKFEKTGELLLNNGLLNVASYEAMEKEGVHEIENNNSLSKVIKDSLYWYGLGLSEKHPSTRLLNFVFVLESLLKKKEEDKELARLVSERCALLLYEKFEQRKECYQQIKKIYNIRSKIVHTGVLTEDHDLASLAGGYARGVLINIIKQLKNFEGNFDNFIQSIDDKKFRGV